MTAVLSIPYLIPAFDVLRVSGKMKWLGGAIILEGASNWMPVVTVLCESRRLLSDSFGCLLTRPSYWSE